MVTRETPTKARATRRRQTRGAASDGEDTTEPVAEPVVVKRTTRRVSVTTVEPDTDAPAVTETASYQNHVRCLLSVVLPWQVSLWLNASFLLTVRVAFISDTAMVSYRGV